MPHLRFTTFTPQSLTGYVERVKHAQQQIANNIGLNNLIIEPSSIEKEQGRLFYTINELHQRLTLGVLGLKQYVIPVFAYVNTDNEICFSLELESEIYNINWKRHTIGYISALSQVNSTNHSFEKSQLKEIKSKVSLVCNKINTDK